MEVRPNWLRTEIGEKGGQFLIIYRLRPCFITKVIIGLDWSPVKSIVLYLTSEAQAGCVSSALAPNNDIIYYKCHL